MDCANAVSELKLEQLTFGLKYKYKLRDYHDLELIHIGLFLKGTKQPFRRSIKIS